MIGHRQRKWEQSKPTKIKSQTESDKWLYRPFWTKFNSDESWFLGHCVLSLVRDAMRNFQLKSCQDQDQSIFYLNHCTALKSIHSAHQLQIDSNSTIKKLKFRKISGVNRGRHKRKISGPWPEHKSAAKISFWKCETNSVSRKFQFIVNKFFQTAIASC